MVGANEIQIVDFTLSEDLNLSSNEGLEIDNVYLPDGTYSEFGIYPSSLITITNDTIIHLFGPTNALHVSQSGTSFIYHKVNDGFKFYDEANGVIYDATNKKLKIKTFLPNVYLRAGNYRLVIW